MATESFSVDGMKALYVRHYEECRAKYLSLNPGTNSIAIWPGENIFWIVNFDVQGQKSKRVFQGADLQQLVNAIYEFANIKKGDEGDWEIYLQGHMLSEPIGRFVGMYDHWALTWDKITLSWFYKPGEEIEVKLLSKLEASSTKLPGQLIGINTYPLHYHATWYKDFHRHIQSCDTQVRSGAHDFPADSKQIVILDSLRS